MWLTQCGTHSRRFRLLTKKNVDTSRIYGRCITKNTCAPFVNLDVPPMYGCHGTLIGNVTPILESKVIRAGKVSSAWRAGKNRYGMLIGKEVANTIDELISSKEMGYAVGCPMLPGVLMKAVFIIELPHCAGTGLPPPLIERNGTRPIRVVGAQFTAFDARMLVNGTGVQTESPIMTKVDLEDIYETVLQKPLPPHTFMMILPLT